MDDVVTADFQSLIASGDIVNNPCHMVRSAVSTHGNGYYRSVNDDHDYIIEGDGSLTRFALSKWPLNDIRVSPTLSDTHVDYHVRAAKASCLGNIDRAPYSIAEDIAEIRETVRFLKNPAESLRNLHKEFYWKVSRFAKKNKVPRTKALANVWLTYRFAFMPLINSLSTIYDSLSAVDTKASRFVARGFSKTSPSNQADSYTIFSATHRNVFDHKIDEELDVTAGVLYEILKPRAAFAQKYGLRLKDIPETAWAVVPYSFMVDRVVNISQGLRGLTSLFDPNVKVLTGWTRYKKSQVTTLSWIREEGADGYTNTHIPDVTDDLSFIYHRDTWEPNVYDLAPVEKPLGLIKDITSIIDLLSLVVQRV
jgi:hypothetical protein